MREKIDIHIRVDKVLISTIAICFTYIVSLYSHAGNLLIHPRFWAEEAKMYFAYALNNGIGVLSHAEHAGYIFLLNLSSYISYLLPLKFAPFATTYVSLFVDIVAVLFIIALFRSGRIRFVPSICLVVLWVLCIPKYETQLTATNIQWICAAGLVFLLPLRESELVQYRVALYVWVLVCGMTGIPSVMLFPAFVLVGISEKSRVHFTIAIYLFICAIFHAVVIYYLPNLGEREFSSDPLLYVVATLVHTIVAPAVGLARAEIILMPLRESVSITTQAAVVVLAAGVAVVAILTTIAARSSSWAIAVSLACLWLGTGVIQSFGSIGNPANLVVPSHGSRYFLTGLVCIYIMLGLGASHPTRYVRYVCVALMIYLSAVVIVQRWELPSNLPAFLNGPDWQGQVAACVKEAPCEVEVWPPSWKITIPPGS